MPEIPDLELYCSHLTARLQDQPLRQIRIVSPFVLRSVSPEPAALTDMVVHSVRRMAKQIVLEFEHQHYLVFHLMLSGRLHWKKAGVNVPKRNGLAALDFEDGALLFTESSKKKRASLRCVQGDAALAALDPGGVDLLDISAETFLAVLRAHAHTVKRVLTDQRIFAGVGNAYSDEILLRAGLSPFARSNSLSNEQALRLYDAVQTVLHEWLERLRAASGDKFPEKVTAFHDEMAVHGRYRKPCPVCAAPVQRVVYAESEFNYCARCQTGGKVLADRSLSRLLKDSWPRRIEELEGPS